jgi:hypothetical protein
LHFFFWLLFFFEIRILWYLQTLLKNWSEGQTPRLLMFIVIICDRYCITVNQVMVATVKLSKRWLQLNVKLKNLKTFNSRGVCPSDHLYYSIHCVAENIWSHWCKKSLKIPKGAVVVFSIFFHYKTSSTGVGVKLSLDHLNRKGTVIIMYSLSFLWILI